MGHAFLTLVNMSVAGAFAIPLAIVLRSVILRGAKWPLLLVWGVIALRLSIPVFFESRLALIPAVSLAVGSNAEARQAETAPQNAGTGKTFIPIGTSEVVQTTHDPIQTVPPRESAAPTAAQEAPYMTAAPIPAAATTDEDEGSGGAGSGLVQILFWVWLSGCAAMLLYSLISYSMLKRKLVAAVKLREGVYESEYVSSPFTIGILHPCIYVPFGLDDKRLQYVLGHEKAHLRFADHVWKAFGFAVLTLHWFNPLVWLAYALFCRDLELACDERVIKALSEAERIEYSQTLLDLTAKRHGIGASPLAFGEGDAKARIKSVLTYKKPKAALIVIAVLLTLLLTACSFTANRPKDAETVDGNKTEDASSAPSPSPEPTAPPKQTAVPTGTPDPDADAEFSDPAFEERMRWVLGLEAGERITNADLSDITQVVIAGEDIRSIEDAHKLPNLNKLILNGTPNINFSELSEFGELESLVVINCGIKGISFVEPLTQLNEFEFDGAEVTDLSPLAGHEALRTLCFGSTGVVELSPIERLPLSRLGISDQPGMDLSPVGRMTTLKELSLINCGLTDCGFISKLTSLTFLNLYGNYIADIAPLSAFSRLRQVVLTNNRIENIDVLFGLGELSMASLSFNPIPLERIDALNAALSSAEDDSPVEFYPRDRGRLACWPVDLDDDGTDEYFCLDLDWLIDDFVSVVWIENADHRLLGSRMYCGTGHVAYNTFAVVESPVFGTCLMQIYPEWGGTVYGYELYDIENADLRSVRNVSFYSCDPEQGNLMDKGEAAAYEAEVNALLGTGCLLVSTDSYGVLTGTFVDPRTGEEFSITHGEGGSSAIGLIRGFGSVGGAISSRREEMEERGFVFFDDPVTYRFRIDPDHVAGD